MRGITDRLSRRAVVASAVMAAAAPLWAQRTWVVDASSGPGTDFTDVPPAVAAAADGDTVRIRAGTYSGFATHKALTVLGDSGVQVQRIEVNGLPAEREFVAKDLQAQAVRCVDARGRVHLAAVRVLALIGTSSIHDCALVTVNRSSLLGGLGIVRSQVVLTDTHVAPLGAVRVALDIVDATVWITGGTYTGSSANCGFAQLVPESAIAVSRSRLRITGDRALVAAGAGDSVCFLRPPTPAIRADAATRLVVDPNVRLTWTYGPPAVRGTALVSRRIPGLLAAGAGPGETLTTDLYAPAGRSTATLVSLPAAPTAVPFGTVWLDLGHAFVVDTGTVDATEHRRNRFAITPGSFPRGLPLVFQAAVLDGARLETSSPVTVVLH